MKTSITPALQFFLTVAKIQTIMNRRFDTSLGGLGLTELIILLQLSEAPDTKMRRIDLAEQVGLTASGVTRILLPMEKVGLITKEANASDARVSLVMLAPGGKRKLEEGLERAELLSNEILPKYKDADLDALKALLAALTGSA